MRPEARMKIARGDQAKAVAIAADGAPGASATFHFALPAAKTNQGRSSGRERCVLLVTRAPSAFRRRCYVVAVMAFPMPFCCRGSHDPAWPVGWRSGIERQPTVPFRRWRFC
jgi:hypothetical protein